MWAMIGTSIALGVWTAGLLWFTVRAEKQRVVEAAGSDGVMDGEIIDDKGIKSV